MVRDFNMNLTNSEKLGGSRKTDKSFVDSGDMLRTCSIWDWLRQEVEGGPSFDRLQGCKKAFSRWEKKVKLTQDPC